MKTGSAAGTDAVQQSYKQMVVALDADARAKENEMVVAVADTQTMNEHVKTVGCNQTKGMQLTAAGVDDRMMAAGVGTQMTAAGIGTQMMDIQVAADAQMRGKWVRVVFGTLMQGIQVGVVEQGSMMKDN